MRYDFECPDHGIVEVTCSMKDIQQTMPCPQCGKESKRIYTPTSVIYKGGDWASKKPKKITDVQNKDWKGKGEGYC